MPDNVVDFNRQREARELKRKEDRVEAMRRAFRLARNGSESEKPAKNRKRRNKNPKRSRK